LIKNSARRPLHAALLPVAGGPRAQDRWLLDAILGSIGTKRGDHASPYRLALFRLNDKALDTESVNWGDASSCSISSLVKAKS